MNKNKFLFLVLSLAFYNLFLGAISFKLASWFGVFFQLVFQCLTAITAIIILENKK